MQTFSHAVESQKSSTLMRGMSTLGSQLGGKLAALLEGSIGVALRDG